MSKRAGRKPATSKRPRSKLGLPDLDHSKAAVLDSLRSPESKRGFQHAIDEFIQRYCSEPRLSLDKVAVTRFRIFTFAFLWVYPAFFTCIWVWLYAGSGLALKMLRRAGGIIEWLTLKLDIENKPLQSLAFVAGGRRRMCLLERVYLKSSALILNTQAKVVTPWHADQLRNDLACAD